MNDMTRPPAKPEGNPNANFPAMLKAYGTEIARALPKHMNGDRMARIALTAFRSTPKLAECDPRSVFAAVIQSAQLGLEVGLMGEAYLVPYNGTCQLIPGYQGLMKLARNSGLVEDIYAHEVRERDHFQMTLGLTRTLQHEPLKARGFPACDDERGEIVGFYAVAVFKDGSRTFQAMSCTEVNRIRDNSSGYKAAKKYKKESPWDTEYVEMGKKTVIRRLCKFMPKSPELAAALALDDTANRGKDQGLDVEKAIEGTWAPTEDDPSAPEATREDAKPPYPEDQFAKNIKGWRDLITKGKKSPDDVIATIRTKNSLTEVQELEIRSALADAPASAEAVALLRAKIEAAALTDADVLKRVGAPSLDKLTSGQVDIALEYVANPMGAQS